MHDPYRGTGPTSRDGTRKRVVQISLTACVVVVSVVMVAVYLLVGREQLTAGTAVAGSPTAGQVESVRVSSDTLITKDGEPKVVVALYEDFLCPACGRFEKEFGPTIAALIDSGTIAADYYLIAILDAPFSQHYSSRSAGAAYCVADYSVEAFRRFHAALFADQPDEFSGSFPTDEQLAATARAAGAAGDTDDCITSRRYVPMTQGLSKATGVSATPTVHINGEEYELTTPEALADRVTELANR